MIVDAGVAIKWFVEEEGRDRALALIGGEPLCAPETVLAECFNAGWRLLRLGKLTDTQFAAMTRRLERLFDELAPVRSLAARAAEISLALDHPIYDCLYLALAEKNRDRLATANRRLVEKVAAGPWQERVLYLYAIEAPT